MQRTWKSSGEVGDKVLLHFLSYGTRGTYCSRKATIGSFTAVLGHSLAISYPHHCLLPHTKHQALLLELDGPANAPSTFHAGSGKC